MHAFKKLFYAFLCASLLTAALGIQPAYAASIVVNSAADTVANDGACTLREAITNANANDQSGSTDCAAGSGADAITFAANYIITLGSQLPAIATNITINGNGAANTIIEANVAPNTATYRVLEVAGTGNLTLDGVTIRNGKDSDGGGIYNSGTATISASTISGNTSDNGGGGIYNWGTATITITASTISGNTADGGGGGITNYGTATISASTISGNTANMGNGGGISNYGTATLTASTISGNTADSGGGISNRGPLSVTNSTLAGNSATSAGGGALRNGNASIATLINVTISGNASTSQAAVWNESGTLHLTNTLIANSSGVTAVDCLNSSVLGTNANNLIEDNTCSPALSGDPMLGALANNGGFTQTFALQTGSPAIDAGTNAGCPADDQRGVLRPRNVTCDIGAYEYSSDATFPTVITTSLVASYITTGPSAFTVTFSENVADYAGNSNPNDVTNPVNYLLVENGADNAFNTASCAGGLLADDTQVAVIGVTYNAVTFTSNVTLSGALPVGVYRLFVCGTTSIVDPSLNELNNGLSDYIFNFVVTTASTANASSLPSTGFAPNRITTLPVQPAELAYRAMGDLWLEIPALKIKSVIVGVPQASDKTWNVDWLGANAGWLNGTAFPTWNGNSVLTAHVTDTNGLPGPFAAIKSLTYGDKVIVHLLGQQYIYEVRDTRLARPTSTSYAFKSLQDHSYLTLITCQDYNASSDSYLFRMIVRAILVEVK